MKRLNYISTLFILFCSIFLISSCDDSIKSNPDPVLQKNKVVLTIRPVIGDLTGVVLEDVTIEFEDANKSQVVEKFTKQNTNFAKVGDYFVDTLELASGSFNVKANAVFKVNDETIESDGSTLGVNLSSAQKNIPVMVTVYSKQQTHGLVLLELFTSGSKKSNGSYYLYDKYFVIYNNSPKGSEPIKLNGVAICEGNFLTQLVRENLTPDKRDESACIRTLYMIPHDGKEYLLEPGQKFVLADQAADHTDKEGLDLSHADFEWYDVSKIDIDNPEVPNLVKYFSYSKNIWTPHNTGVCGYALIRIPDDGTTIEDFVTKYKYDYTYTQIVQGEEKVMEWKNKALALPLDWVIDAVNMGQRDNYLFYAFPDQLDRGYTWVTHENKANPGHSAQRKLLREVDGVKIYKDTNNSSEDFIPETSPTYYKAN